MSGNKSRPSVSIAFSYDELALLIAGLYCLPPDTQGVQILKDLLSVRIQELEKHLESDSPELAAVRRSVDGLESVLPPSTLGRLFTGGPDYEQD